MTVMSYLGYCITAMAIIIVPGPTVTVIIANSLRYGTRAGLINVVGTQAGLLVWLVVAVFGLSEAITFMGWGFSALKLAGAVYLAWLGVKLLRSTGDMMTGPAEPPHGGFFLQGFLVILSNPKVLVLFGALIPQFANPEQDFTQQLVVMGLTFMALATLLDGAYAVLAGKAGALMSRGRVRRVEIVSGLFLTAGAMWLALKAFPGP